LKIMWSLQEAFPTIGSLSQNTPFSLGGPQSRSEPLPKIEPRLLERVARSLVTISTEL
jgi:hypothetical protein